MKTSSKYDYFVRPTDTCNKWILPILWNSTRRKTDFCRYGAFPLHSARAFRPVCDIHEVDQLTTKGGWTNRRYHWGCSGFFSVAVPRADLYILSFACQRNLYTLSKLVIFSTASLTLLATSWHMDIYASIGFEIPSSGLLRTMQYINFERYPRVGSSKQFVGLHNVEKFAVPTRIRNEVYVTVRDAWRRIEQPSFINVKSPSVLFYF